MNFIEMQQALDTLLSDSSLDIKVQIPNFINEAVQQIAEEVKFAELKQITPVTTNPYAYWVNMPASFSSRLKYAGDAYGEFEVLDGGVEELIRLYPALNRSGSIQHIACEGGILYYQPIPTEATSITCIGYRLPDVLQLDTDTPDFIPAYYRREAIVNKAASIAYNIIEDGIEGDKVNTKIFTGLAELGIMKLKVYVSKRRPVMSTSVWSV